MPTIAISPRIQAGTVCQAKGNTPFDHTTILKTVQKRWNLPSLTKRDAAAEDIGDVISLETVRTDDALASIDTPVVYQDNSTTSGKPNQLQNALVYSLYSELNRSFDLAKNMLI